MKAEEPENKMRMVQILRLLIERDGFVCGICGGEIVDVRQADVDHIIPSVLGGEDKSENLQPAHMSCNRIKSGTIYPHLKQKPRCERVDQILSIPWTKEKTWNAISHAIQKKQKAEKAKPEVAKPKATPVVKVKKHIPRTPLTPKPNKKRIPLLVEKVDSDAPVRLWNEMARHGFKKLSYDIFLSHFTDYRKAPGEYKPL